MPSAAPPRSWPRRSGPTCPERAPAPGWTVLALAALIGMPAPLAAPTAQAARELAAASKNSGVRAYQEARLAQAIADLTVATNISLNDFFAHYYLGLALRDSRRHAEARAVLRVAEQLDPRYLPVYVALGDVALGLGEPDQAATEYQKAVSRQGNYSPALDGLGRLAEARGDPEQAIVRYREAIRANPGYAPPYVHLGAIFLRQQRRDEAVALFREALRFRPDFAAGYALLGLAYGELGRRNEAASLLEKAAALEPENPEHRLVYGRLALGWDDRLVARRELEAALALAPDRHEPLVALADLERREGRYDAALERLATAGRLPRLPEGLAPELEARGAAWRAEGERRRGLEAAAAGGDGAARLGLARLLRDTGDGPGAALHCREAANAFDKPVDLLFECGWAALSAGLPEQAAPLFEDVVAARPDDPRAWVNLGLAHAGLGRVARAIDAYRKALGLQPAQSEAATYLGNALYRVGRRREAEAAWRDALRTSSDPETIARLRRTIERLTEELEQEAEPPPATPTPPATNAPAAMPPPRPHRRPSASRRDDARRPGPALSALLALLVPAPARGQSAPAARAGLRIQITEPAEGAPVFGPTRITAEIKADDPTRIIEVRFLVGEAVVFVDREAPWQTSWDFGSSGNSAIIRAVATHTEGYSVETVLVTRPLRLSYEVEVRRVVLTLTVVDSAGAPIAGLRGEDFRIEEDGKPQSILEFSVEERPLRLALVVDTSGSMREALREAQSAGVAFLDVLKEGDQALVVDFDDQVMLLQDMTAEREGLRTAIVSTSADGGTALYDAVHATLRRLARETERRAIVLLSDGGDTASVFSRDRALEAAKTSDTILYAIGLGGSVDRSVLKELAEQTGGRAFFADNATELAGLYARIAAELRQQYHLAYASENTNYNGKWRRIEVSLPSKPDATARSRTGYYAVGGKKP